MAAESARVWCADTLIIIMIAQHRIETCPPIMCHHERGEVSDEAHLWQRDGRGMERIKRDVHARALPCKAAHTLIHPSPRRAHPPLRFHTQPRQCGPAEAMASQVCHGHAAHHHEGRGRGEAGGGRDAAVYHQTHPFQPLTRATQLVGGKRP